MRLLLVTVFSMLFIGMPFAEINCCSKDCDGEKVLTESIEEEHCHKSSKSTKSDEPSHTENNHHQCFKLCCSFIAKVPQVKKLKLVTNMLPVKADYLFTSLETRLFNSKLLRPPILF